MCIIFVVIFVIAPDIIQNNSEQINQTTAAVIALANAKINGLIFITFSSSNSIAKKLKNSLLKPFFDDFSNSKLVIVAYK